MNKKTVDQAYTNTATELKSAQKHLDAALKYLERQRRDPTIEGKFLGSICSLSETAQKCLTLIAVENPPDSN